MAPSPQHHNKRIKIAAKYAKRLKIFSSVSLDKWDLRFFNSSLQQYRNRMRVSLITNVTDELGKDFLNGRTVEVITEYEPGHGITARKLLRATIALVEPHE